LEIGKLPLSVLGIDPDLCNSAYKTPFRLAAQSKHLDLMRAIAYFDGYCLTNRS
jgi:hypothetical protein